MTTLQKHIIENSTIDTKGFMYLLECIDKKNIDLAITIALGLYEMPEIPSNRDSLRSGIDCVFKSYNPLTDSLEYEYTSSSILWFKSQEEADMYIADGDSWKKDYKSNRTDEHTFMAKYVSNERSKTTCSLKQWLDK